MYEEKVIRTRFAPSPSGHLHVGGARTALFCWAYAKARGGKFILRIEDTDQKRSADSSTLAFYEDLDWLGINWDEGPEHAGNGGGPAGPYSQSQRLVVYNKYVGRLIEEGKAYRAFETPEELAERRAEARREGKQYRYDRAALELSTDAIDAYLREGRPHVVRFHVPDGAEVVVEDRVRGDVRVSTSELDDFVIRKADGFPTYHFAVVVDDELMGVSHVIRAAEHLSNTPRHILLQDALGFRRPVYAHVSIIKNPDNSKMSKRDKDKVLRGAVAEGEVTSSAAVDDKRWAWWRASKDHQLDSEETTALAEELGITLPEIDVIDFKRSGYMPEVIVNYLALLGWNPGDDTEQFDRDFFMQRFDFDRAIKSDAKFDRDKLLAFNLDAIQKMSEEEFAKRFHEYLVANYSEFPRALHKERFAMFAHAQKTRAKTFSDQLESCRFLISSDEDITYETTKAVRKALTKGEPCGFDHLAALRERMATHDDWSINGVAQVMKAYADECVEGKLGNVAQPLRVAVSGTTVSPPIYDTLAILGKESVVRRIERCLEQRQVVGSK